MSLWARFLAAVADPVCLRVSLSLPSPRGGCGDAGIGWVSRSVREFSAAASLLYFTCVRSVMAKWAGETHASKLEGECTATVTLEMCSDVEM